MMTLAQIKSNAHSFFPLVNSFPTSAQAFDKETGLFRTLLAGPGATVREAFHQLRETGGRNANVGNLIAHGGDFAAHLSLNEAMGGWDLYEFARIGFAVVQRCNFLSSRAEIAPAEGLVEFHISLNGRVELDRQPSAWVAGDVALLLCRQGEGASYRVRSLPGPRQGISLYVEPSFLRSSVGFGDVLDSMDQKVAPETIVSHVIYLPVEVAELASLLFDNSFQGVRRLTYARSILIQILCLCSLATERQCDDETSQVFTPRDLQMFERARERLMVLDTPITITELARSLGTNATKLKNGFKMIYGTTIFDFASSYRLGVAMHMLAEDKLTVGEVALRTGYKHQASFTAAFKKRFGICPKAARRLGSANY